MQHYKIYVLHIVFGSIADLIVRVPCVHICWVGYRPRLDSEPLCLPPHFQYVS